MTGGSVPWRVASRLAIDEASGMDGAGGGSGGAEARPAGGEYAADET